MILKSYFTGPVRSVAALTIQKSFIFRTNDKIVIACYSYTMDIIFSF